MFMALFLTVWNIFSIYKSLSWESEKTMDKRNMSLKELESILNTDFERGISDYEAEKRLHENGKNIISHNDKRKNIFVRFIMQFSDFMVITLIIASVVSFVVSKMQGESDYIDSFIILVIVVFNAVLGVVQESRAEKAIEALKKLSSPHTKVIREGKVKEILSEDVVLGDVVLIETGDFISADGRIIECNGIKAEESSLTGESLAVSKDINFKTNEKTSLGDRKNMVFASSYITAGKGKAVVISTGLNTEVGRIAKMMIDEEETETPMQKRLSKTGQTLGTAAVIICLVIFLMGVLRKGDWFEMFMTSISLAVAAIPEGLPAIVTIVLAIGMQNMSKKNAIIRKLPAVETLGSASVICSDKTGTLTQNRMRVVTVTDSVKKITDDISKKKFILKLSALCNNCRYEDRKVLGEPTEKALMEGAIECGESIFNINSDYKRIYEIPFSSERKLMTTVHKMKNGKYISITKGAPDVLIKLCDRVLDRDLERNINSIDIENIKKLNNNMAEGALRVIAVAYNWYNEKPLSIKSEFIEKNLVFAGLAGISDPPRPEVYDAVKTCVRAGIKPVMITGDHVVTAKAIAKEIGIYKDGDRTMTGAELNIVPDEYLRENIEKYSVFARVSPEHKVRIVKAFKSKGYITAMTGDGVNDAPALKSADIGCAMGKNGTDVAKGAADMILADDNFATITEAVREGRRIYANIKKSIHFLISSNIGEIITIFVAMCFGWATPLLPIQLLWVNLVTDSLPAVALGMDKADKDIMEKPPVSDNGNIFSGGLGLRIALEGCMIGMLSLLAFAIGHVYFDEGVGYSYGRTMAFAVLSISQLVHAFNMRSEGSIFKINIFSNKILVVSFIVGLILQSAVITVPKLSYIFKVCTLDFDKWLIVFILSFMPIVIVELEKLLGKR